MKNEATGTDEREYQALERQDGDAGVYFVCYQLAMRGLTALPTIRSAKGIDVPVSSADGRRLATLQVL